MSAAGSDMISRNSLEPPRISLSSPNAPTRNTFRFPHRLPTSYVQSIQKKWNYISLHHYMYSALDLVISFRSASCIKVNFVNYSVFSTKSSSHGIFTCFPLIPFLYSIFRSRNACSEVCICMSDVVRVFS